MTEVGIGISRPTWRIRVGVCSDEFSWTPGIAESGRATPSSYFDAVADVHWRWVWLWFVVFFVKARAYY